MVVNITHTAGDFDFKLNGISYARNFHGYVAGDKLRIVNAYDSSFVLVNFQVYSDFTVNGNPAANVQELSELLSEILFLKEGVTINVGGGASFPRIATNNIGASYTLVDAQHGSKNIYSSLSTVTLSGVPADMTAGFLSFHVNNSNDDVTIGYDPALVEVIGHDPVNDDPLKIKALSAEPSKGGVQIDYIGFNSTTNKMEYHVYGALV